jgi:ligand-binding sensor protein/AraC-like DNA-binding protein
MAELRIGSVLDLDHLQRVLTGFSEATGLATLTVDARGVPVTSPCAFTEFCKRMRSDPVRSQLCHGCDAHGGLQSAINGSPYLYRCHAGLVDFSVPVMVDDTYIGAIACGQVRVPEEEQPTFLAAGPSWRDDPEMQKLYELVPVVNSSKVRAAAETLEALRGDMGGSASHPRPRQLLPLTPVTSDTDADAPSGGLPTLSLVVVKDVPASPATPEPSPADTSREDLRAALDAEDLASAVRVVSVLLDAVYASPSGQRERVAAIEDLVLDVGGECCPRIVPHLTQAVQRTRGSRASRLTRYDTQLYIERLLMTVLDGIERGRPHRRRDLRDLLNDIARNPGHSLSLTEAASKMHLSPGHLSKLFKSATGCNFVSYVTSRRIARARLMLASTEMPVQKIAAELDFNQVNYFSRVFRSYTGMSPSEYRRTFAARDGRLTGAPVSAHDDHLLRA